MRKQKGMASFFKIWEPKETMMNALAQTDGIHLYKTG